MDIAAIRAAVAAAVGSAMSDVQTFGVVPDRIEAPAFSAGEVEIDYDKTFGPGGTGLQELVCKGRIYASRADVTAGQANLDAYLARTGSRSVKAAVEADRTLGGVCRTLRVERVHGYGRYEVGGVDYYGAQFDIRIWAL